MIKIIEGKRYNTTTATEVAAASNGYASENFYWEAETLYLTKNGSWFLHGEGGANTNYARQLANERLGGEDLQALTSDQAYAWLESNQKIEAIERHFADRLADA